MDIKLLLLLACAGVALRPADGTLLASKKLVAVAVAAVKKPLVALGLASPPAPHHAQHTVTVVMLGMVTTTHKPSERSESQDLFKYDIPEPAPQHTSGKHPTTIILNVGNQIAQPQPPVQEGYLSSSQVYLPNRPIQQSPGGHGPPPPLGHGPLHSAPGHPLWGIPGALANLWSKSQQAVVAKTNRVRDRFAPLKPLSYLLSGAGGLHKPQAQAHNGVEYNLVPSVGFSHYNEINYYPVKSVETKILEETKPYLPIVVEEAPYPSAEPSKEYKQAEEYKAPELVYNAPAHEIYVPSHPYPAPEYAAPTIDYTLPKIEYTEPKLDYTVPKNEYTAPKIDYILPKTELALPSTGYAAPSVEYTAPKTDYIVPKIEYTAPSVEYTAPKTDYTVPKIEYTAPKTDYTIPKDEYKPPKIEYTAPKTEYKAPKPEYSVPAQEYSAPNQGSTSVQYELYPPITPNQVPAEEYRPAELFRSADAAIEVVPASATYRYKLLKSVS